MLLKMKKIGNSYHLLLPMAIARQFVSRTFVDVTIGEQTGVTGQIQEEKDEIKEAYVEEDGMAERSKFEGA